MRFSAAQNAAENRLLIMVQDLSTLSISGFLALMFSWYILNAARSAALQESIR
jgi:hypothetical protein